MDFSETVDIGRCIARGELEQVQRARQNMVWELVEKNSGAEEICRAIAGFNRRTERAALAFFGREYPWLEHCTFLEFGSGAREEQVLSSDQDNGLLWKEEPDPNQLDEASQRLVLTLDGCGLRLCPGQVMVSSEKWRGDFHAWRKRLTKWLLNPRDEGGWQLGTIVDFLPVSGRLYEQAEALRSELRGLVRDHPAILKNLALEIAEYKAPVTFWGGFVLEREGGLKGSMDVKHAILSHLTNAARLLCLKHGIDRAHTRERISALGEDRHIPKKMARDLAELWAWAQYKRIISNLDYPDRLQVGVNPYRLNKEEQKRLRRLLHSLDRFISLVRQGSGI
ncbi:MAG: DUF294 nucleotidyltransferase-like domain-containing protein [Desulfonatronovibrionaceae bacterium]